MNVEQNHNRFSSGGGNMVVNSNNMVLQILESQTSQPLPHPRRCPPPSEKFTGRRQELLKMASFFFREELVKRIFLLIGIGGCGKSQLAWHFFHEQVLKSDKFDPLMVFFLDATTTATLEDSYKAIAESKGIGSSAQDALSWLATTTTPSFLLLDNADDPNINLRDFLPNSTKVAVLITTRLHHYGESYGSGRNSSIHLEGLLEADAEHLLMTTSGVQETERPSARMLVKELHYYALAVAQAGAGIRVLHLSVEEYSVLFRQQRTALMNGKNDGVKPQDLDDYHYNAQSAYRISVRHLRNNPSAMSLLKLLGHLHHMGITEDMFRRAFTQLKDYEPVVPLSHEENSALSLLRDLLSTFSGVDGKWDSLAFRRAMNELVSLSLVSYDKTNGYQIHAITGDALRDDHPDSRPTAFLLSLAHDSDEDDAAFIHASTMHAERVLSSYDDQVIATLHPDLARGLGAMSLFQGQSVARSEKLLKISVARCQRDAAGDSHSCLRSLGALRNIVRRAGRYEEAQQMDAQLVEKRVQALGPEHPETLRAMARQAETLCDLGNYTDAEPMERQVFEKRKSILGPDHRDTVHAMSYLAYSLYSLKRFDEAEPMQRLAFEKQTEILGPYHPDTITTGENLALTLQSLGRHDEAVTLGRQAVERQTATLGPYHPLTLTTAANLSTILYSIGRYEEAERMDREVLDKRLLTFGSVHSNVALAMYNLAHTLRKLGRKDEARNLMDQGGDVSAKCAGEDHAETVGYRLVLSKWREEDNDDTLQPGKAASDLQARGSLRSCGRCVIS